MSSRRYTQPTTSLKQVSVRNRTRDLPNTNQTLREPHITIKNATQSRHTIKNSILDIIYITTHYYIHTRAYIHTEHTHTHTLNQIYKSLYTRNFFKKSQKLKSIGRERASHINF